MKKIFLLASCIMSGLLYAEDTYTHKITVSFTVEVSPTSQEQWQEIRAHFDQFLMTAQQNDRTGLMNKLEEAFYGIPEYCQTNNIHGTTGINFSVEAPEID